MSSAILTFLLAGSVALAAPAAGAQNKNNKKVPATVPMGQTKKGPSQAGTAFIKQVAQGNLAEIKLGELAERQGASTAVRQYGAALVSGHTKAEEQTKSLADQEGVPLPDKPSSQQQAEYTKLASMHGQQFDKAFLKSQIKMHQKEIAKFEGEAKGGKDPNIAAFASRMAPTLKTHLKMAQDAQSKVAAKKPSKQPTQTAVSGGPKGRPQPPSR